MRNITTGYCIKAHVELSTEMQNLKGGKGKYVFFIKRIKNALLALFTIKCFLHWRPIHTCKVQLTYLSRS